MKVCVLIWLSALMLCVACSSRPVQTSEYLLRPQPASTQDYAEPSIGLGKIEVAPYLDHEGIVLEIIPGEINTAQHHRWADPLDFAIRRYLQVAIGRAAGLDIAGSLTETSAVETQIDVMVYQLHGSVSGNVKLVAEWQIQSIKSGDMLARRRFGGAKTIQGDGYAEIVRAHAALLDELAESIADEIR